MLEPASESPHTVSFIFKTSRPGWMKGPSRGQVLIIIISFTNKVKKWDYQQAPSFSSCLFSPPCCSFSSPSCFSQHLSLFFLFQGLRLWLLVSLVLGRARTNGEYSYASLGGRENKKVGDVRRRVYTFEYRVPSLIRSHCRWL